MTFLKADKFGYDKATGHLLFSMIASDGKRYEFGMPPECFMHLAGGGWKAARDLPPAPDQGTSVELQGAASFAIVNMQPALILMSGPLVLSLALDEEKMAVLNDGMNEFRKMDKGPKH